jgi:hypothetical protein
MRKSPSKSVADPSSSMGSLRYSFGSSNGSSEGQSSSYISADSIAKSHGANPDPLPTCCPRCCYELEVIRATLNQMEESVNDSLNFVTDRINFLEVQMTENNEELRAERKAGHESMRRTLSEVSRRLISFIRQLFTVYPLIKQRRPTQSRIGMRREASNTSVRE